MATRYAGPHQTATQQAIVARVRRAPVVVKASVPPPGRPATARPAARVANRPQTVEFEHEDFWALAAALPAAPNARGARGGGGGGGSGGGVQPFPQTDLRRVQLLGMLDAMVNSTPPPPTHALYEVLAALERYHGAYAAAAAEGAAGDAGAAPVREMTAAAPPPGSRDAPAAQRPASPARRAQPGGQSFASFAQSATRPGTPGAGAARRGAR